MDTHLALVTFALALVALLYSSVGHAGASGYIAVLTLSGFAPDFIKPAALTLNLLVGSIATVQFARAGHLRLNLVWPFALLSVPMSFVGASLPVSAQVFRVIVGLVLLASAARFLFPLPEPADRPTAPSRPKAFGIGAVLGLLAGLTGTGGGIFLTPLLLLCRWARSREAAAASALFIVCNSASGLAGQLLRTGHLPAASLPFAVAVGLGGTLGAHLGSRRFTPTVIKRILAAALFLAGGKLCLT
jgi:uncharacterized protein